MSTAPLTANAIGILRQLVAFDSVSCNSNLPVIDFIERMLKPLGFACMRVPSHDGVKCNFLARIGPDVAGGIVLSGHTDVVPTAGQQWDSDPFALREDAGKLYGRGTADMKAFIAACLALAPEFSKMKMEKPIYFAFSYDEEVGCIGVPHLLRYMQDHIAAPAFALIGEPTLMQVVTAHKGVLSFETTVYGLEAHSSQPHLGVNSLHIGCELVHFLTKLGAQIAQSGARDERFEPPCSTLHVGIIRSGTARNIIAKECFINWEIRPIPGDDPDKLIAQFDDYCREWIAKMQRTDASATIVTKPMSRMLAVTLPPDADTIRQRVMRAANTNAQHAVSFATEAGVFNEFGIPAIVCGPGSIDQAHKPNEFIDIAQIGECVEFLQRLVAEVTGNG
jgi:acetylornithine deacetylase